MTWLPCGEKSIFFSWLTGKMLLYFYRQSHMKIKLFLFLSLFIISVTSLFGETNEMMLRDNLSKAKPGDFLVTAQNKNYTMMIIKSREGELLNVEEITMPMSRVPNEGFSWRNWVQQGAPGNTCWLMYTIHLPTGAMQQIFSFTRNEWVTIPQSQNFMSTLLNLNLKKIAYHERKKVGPPPASDQPDRRAYWQPKLVVDGKTVNGVIFDGWRTKWPKDGSELSGKIIEVYVPKENDKYPSYFPYWLQVSGVVGNAKVRIIDSGTGLYHNQLKNSLLTAPASSSLQLSASPMCSHMGCFDTGFAYCKSEAPALSKENFSAECGITNPKSS